MCLTCDIVTGRVEPPGAVIYKDQFILVNHSLDIHIPGYVILSPVRHVGAYHEMTDEEVRAISGMVKTVSAILQGINGVEKVYIVSFGEETKHFHFHVFPRYRWMTEEPVDMIFTCGQLDGSKLFSYLRKKYKTDYAEMECDAIYSAVGYIHQSLKGGSCDG